MGAAGSTMFVCLGLSLSLAATACSSPQPESNVASREGTPTPSGGTGPTDAPSATDSPTPTPTATQASLPSLEPLDKPCTWQIGAVGALSSDVGRPLAQGIELAVARINAEPAAPCSVQVHARDSGGEPKKTVKLVRGLLRNEKLVACVCGFFSGEIVEVGHMLSERGIPFAGPGLAPYLSMQGFDTWFAAAASDDVQGRMAGRYIAGLRAPRVGIVYTRGDGYSFEVADGVLEGLRGIPAMAVGISPHMNLYRAARRMQRFDPSIIYLAGPAEDWSPFARQFYSASVQPRFMTSDAGIDPDFDDEIGNAGEDALASCACSDVERLADPAFAELYRGEYGEDPGVYSPELYDVVTFFGEGLSRARAKDSAGRVRSLIVRYLRRSNGLRGVAKTYEWNSRGELKNDAAHVWIYRWNEDKDDFETIGTLAKVVSSV